MAPYTGKCSMKVKEDGAKICVTSKGFFDLKGWNCHMTKSEIGDIFWFYLLDHWNNDFLYCTTVYCGRTFFLILRMKLFRLQVESRIRYPIRGGSPPVPEECQPPSRELFAGWCEYTISDGRTFFYNSKTGEKSWKPPRRRCNTDVRIHTCY